MTRATVKIDGNRCSITVEGHATGSPTVCAAASALSGALIWYLAHEEIPVDVCDVESGRVKVVCYCPEKAVEAFKTVGRGFEMLAYEYPEYITSEFSGEK